MTWIGWLGTAFGLGLSPVLPGTVGALPGAAAAYGLSRRTLVVQLVAAGLLAVLAVPVADGASRELGGYDDGRIVIDELATFPLATLGLPCARHPALLAVAFVANRAFDITKPRPVARAEAVPGGAGIVLDDAVASLLAWPFGWLAYLVLYRRRVEGGEGEEGWDGRQDEDGGEGRAGGEDT